MTIIESASPFTALQIITQSDAVAALSESTVRDRSEAERLIELPLALKTQPSGFGVLTRRAEPLTAAATEFIDKLRRSAETEHQETPIHSDSMRRHKHRRLPDCVFHAIVNTVSTGW